MTSLKRARVVPMLLALAMLPGAAQAQTGAASITGLVTDPSGAAAPGVTVTATNQATQRGVHGGLERGRQLHDHVPAGRERTWSRPR